MPLLKPFATSASIPTRRTLLLSSFFVLYAAGLAGETALDRYVKKSDTTYKWNAVGSRIVNGVSVSTLEMTSQTWRSEKDVDKPVWKHFIQVYRPENAKPGYAMLMIAGGNNRGQAPNPDPMSLLIAKDTGVVVAELRQIPSEPLKFSDEKATRTEDEIIAYTWDKFLRGGDEEWPLRLPMTKAAVRAMDTVTDFMKSPAGGGIALDKFIVAGGSKRGWTTWTTAAVDQRVVAIAPMVIDLLNMVPSFVHHYRAYGFWAPAIDEYTKMNIMSWMGTRRFKQLMQIEEPFEYRDRLTLPKFIMNSSGDDFFLPDSSQFYYHKLLGEKHLRYVPNTRHSLGGLSGGPNLSAVHSLAAWVHSIVNQVPRPEFSWKVNRKAGVIEVQSSTAPKEVKVWQCTNPKARDFRLTETKETWTSAPLEGKDGRYVARVPKPASGFTAFFVELKFDSGGKYPHTFTTEVLAIPDVYPHKMPKMKPPVQ